ncbi:hypothetical protein CMT57_00200 [Elizabethkingia anophelis]|uniref:hypothetical protein n=1 Tax=Elizabethkingia anophelis TaxID=1117645 RepID=UPI002010E98B|nr:hypothetical protein [Elizabethkingia anophelis]MCL1688364.1 hypothetical protein [Elizabethkingia anophelis]MDV4008257.1 hypothetical protein [Elizabethkingia anophelis]
MSIESLNIPSNGKTNIQQKSVFDKEITNKKYKDFIRYAYRSVVEGYARSQKYIANNPFEFFNKRHQASTINSMILADFYSKLESDFKAFDMSLKMSTYGMTYFLLDNKALFCFKAMGKNKKINNASTVRFDDTIAGNDVTLKQSVLKELQRRGIEYQPPIFYFVHIPNENGGITVKLVRFENNEIAFELNLSEFFKSADKPSITIKKQAQDGESKVG